MNVVPPWDTVRCIVQPLYILNHAIDISYTGLYTTATKGIPLSQVLLTHVHRLDIRHLFLKLVPFPASDIALPPQMMVN